MLSTFFFFFTDTATTEIYTLSDTLSLHDALPILFPVAGNCAPHRACRNKSPRSEEHTSELQSPLNISYAVFCLKKKKNTRITISHQRARAGSNLTQNHIER